MAFVEGTSSFASGLQSSLKNMQSGLNLRQPSAAALSMSQFGESFDSFGASPFSSLASPSSAASASAVVDEFITLLAEWCSKTEAALEDSDGGVRSYESTDVGPDSELTYWKHRAQRLTNIVDQLRQPWVKDVIATLSTYVKSSVPSENDSGSTRSRALNQLRRWRQIDIQISEATSEAKDNVKYLQTLEKFIEPLYTGTPETIIDTLPALLNSIKMIHTIARYYNTTERMTGLFVKVTNQCINVSKKSVLADSPPEALWDQDCKQLVSRLESCLRLNETYQEQYRLTKGRFWGGGDWGGGREKEKEKGKGKGKERLS